MGESNRVSGICRQSMASAHCASSVVTLFRLLYSISIDIDSSQSLTQAGLVHAALAAHCGACQVSAFVSGPNDRVSYGSRSVARRKIAPSRISSTSTSTRKRQRKSCTRERLDHVESEAADASRSLDLTIKRCECTSLFVDDPLGMFERMNGEKV